MTGRGKAVDRTITAQELATRSNESYDTVDHWANLGLLVFRRRGRKRLFEEHENMQRCKRIRELQEAGHNLITIKGLLSA